MAKYSGSPWGFLRAKLGDSVGGVWKGIPWSRVRVTPRNPGSVVKMQQSEEGCVRGIIFSPEQMNIRRAVFGLLGCIARKTLPTLIHPVWQRYCSIKNLKKTGSNLFVEKNAKRLWNSMTKGTMFSATNLPNFLLMRVSYGDLEASPAITSATYVPGTGVTTIAWNTTHFTNGADVDDAYLAMYKKPTALEIADYLPCGELYVVGTGTNRVAGTSTINVPSGFVAGDFTAFVFFSDDCADYSPSVSSAVS